MNELKEAIIYLSHNKHNSFCLFHVKLNCISNHIQLIYSNVIISAIYMHVQCSMSNVKYATSFTSSQTSY